MRLRSSVSSFLLLLACLVLLAPWQERLFAQEARGAIVGRITDPQNAVIPKASVVVTNKAMGTKLALVTNDVGFYQATYLIPGLYQITVEAPGFKLSLIHISEPTRPY